MEKLHLQIVNDIDGRVDRMMLVRLGERGFFFLFSGAVSKTLCQITFKPAVSKVGACIMFSQMLEWSLLSRKWHIMQGHTMTLY